jgi:hypothetical protein
MKRVPGALLAGGLASALLATAATPASISSWSASRGANGWPAGWRMVGIPRVPAARVDVVEEGGTAVARIRAEAAAGSLAHALDADPAATPVLRWRWKVDRVVEAADLTRKEGDDFAARVYVTFAVPDESLSTWERARMRLGRLLHGETLPAAALCYVWDNRHPPGTTAWNPYSGQVRMVVVRSGGGGTWSAETRDVAADWRAAFGTRYPGPVPRVSGVVVSADTDQTGEAVTAWFGDLRLDRR